MNNDELQRVLKEAEANGEAAYLRGAYLSGADLRGADLGGANLGGAYLSGADLRRANLSGADLREANLSGANLSGAYFGTVRGNNREIKTIHIFAEYDIAYTFDRLQIGCENHAIDEWWQFDDKRILEMDGKKALKFWRKNKELIKQIIEHSPATVTGKEQ